MITLVNGAGSCFDSSVQVPSGAQVPFVATYSGDSGFTGSSATTTVALAPETALVTSITTSPTPVTYGQSMKMCIRDSPYTSPTQGLVSPGGTATFFDTYLGVTTQICAVPVTPGASGGTSTATCVVTGGYPAASSPQSITATYLGSASFAGSTTATALSQVTNTDPAATSLTAPSSSVGVDTPVT